MTERRKSEIHCEHMLHSLKCSKTLLHNRPIKHKVSHLKQINTSERKKKRKTCLGDKKDFFLFFTRRGPRLISLCSDSQDLQNPNTVGVYWKVLSTFYNPLGKKTTSHQNVFNPVILTFYLTQSFRLLRTPKKRVWSSNPLCPSLENTEHGRVYKSGHHCNIREQGISKGAAMHMMTTCRVALCIKNLTGCFKLHSGGRKENE